MTQETVATAMKLWLLVPDETQESQLAINGLHWKLQNYELSDPKTNPSYTCISYSWGTGRQSSALHNDFEVSDKTVVSLTSALSSDSLISHIWIDAFCVPLTEPQRSMTLQSMGHIYATAKEVVAVLSAETYPALQTMITTDHIGLEEMELLERDEWISRGWTYQETVNCKLLKITCHTPDNAVAAKMPVIKGLDFLNIIGFSLEQLPYSTRQRRELYPNLDAFENVIADYMTADFAERSVLQVMGAIDKRVLTEPKDRFYAMIGAITKKPAVRQVLSPAEAFMQICEEKGDYSFLYSAADRDDRLGRRWRPKSTLESISTLIPWHIVGHGQPGYLEGGTLILEEVVILRQQEFTDEVETLIDKRMDLMRVDDGGHGLQQSQRAFLILREFGFTGTGSHFTLKDGYFFPYKDLYGAQDCKFIISGSLWWSFGAPGILSYRINTADGLLYMPGVFFGKLGAQNFCSLAL
jgi:Heterokaryon incompatibility protein (HET)